MLIRALAVIPMAALLGAAPYLLQQATSASEAAEFGVPASIEAKANPVKPTPEAMATAKRMYGYDCAMCHGDNGDGKGNMASSLKTPLKDWRDPASLKGLTDGDLFYMIKKGKGEMPPEDGRQNDEGLWNTVRIVRSFAKK
jgi:mono/diheme cytochrome c family protein